MPFGTATAAHFFNLPSVPGPKVPSNSWGLLIFIALSPATLFRTHVSPSAPLNFSDREPFIKRLGSEKATHTHTHTRDCTTYRSFVRRDEQCRLVPAPTFIMKTACGRIIWETKDTSLGSKVICYRCEVRY